MYVVKRDGRREAVQFDKITARIKKLVSGMIRFQGATFDDVAIRARMGSTHRLLSLAPLRH